MNRALELLSSRERLLIDGALRIAMVQYAQDAITSEGYPRLVASFKQQEKDCRELLDELEATS